MSFSRIAHSCFYTNKPSQNPTIEKATLSSSQVGRSALAAGLDIATPLPSLQSPHLKLSLELSFQPKKTSCKPAQAPSLKRTRESPLPWLVLADRSATGRESPPSPARVLTTLKWSESALLWATCCSRFHKCQQIELAPLKVKANAQPCRRGTARQAVKSLLNFCASLAF